MVLSSRTCVTRCLSDAFNDSGVCYPCSSACLTCSQYLLCTSCNKGLYLSQDSQCVDKCGPNQFVDNTNNNPLCATCQSPCVTCSSLSFCTSCVKGYILNRNACVPASQGCDSGYFVFNGVCQQCSPNCMTCTQTSTQCTACQPATFLTSSFSCVTTCPPSTYSIATTGLCSPCSIKCLQCTSAL